MRDEDEHAPAVPPLYYSGSGDDLSLSLSSMLAQPRPDPLLGEFKPDEPPPVGERSVAPTVAHSSSSEELAALDVERSLPLQPDQPAGSFDAIATSARSEEPLSEPRTPDPLAALTILPPSFTPLPPLMEPETAPGDSASMDAPFAGLDLSAPPSAKVAARKQEDEEEDDDEEYEDEPPRSSWPFVLLASYASAVTIGLIWVVWGHRMGKTDDEADFLPPPNLSADPGVRAKNSRKLAPPPAISAKHMTTLGHSVKLGGLEVTPVAVTSGPIELRRTLNPSERQAGGADALKLRLKLRNVSKDDVFAPLDEAFLREREAGVSDSYIETGDGQTIEMYHLALASEMAITGQDFQELKPGETLDTLIVSAAGALEHQAPAMTWRVRLRTGIGQTDYLGVQFKDSDIRPGK